MSKNFRETLEEQLKKPEFKKEWDALEPEFQEIRKNLDAQQDNTVPHLNTAAKASPKE